MESVSRGINGNLLRRAAGHLELGNGQDAQLQNGTVQFNRRTHLHGKLLHQIVLLEQQKGGAIDILSDKRSGRLLAVQELTHEIRRLSRRPMQWIAIDLRRIYIEMVAPQIVVLLQSRTIVDEEFLGHIYGGRHAHPTFLA